MTLMFMVILLNISLVLGDFSCNCVCCKGRLLTTCLSLNSQMNPCQNDTCLNYCRQKYPTLCPADIALGTSYGTCRVTALASHYKASGLITILFMTVIAFFKQITF
ncbi:unnamed protein product [Adineta ricciae]|uniref:Kazal-like domain-containing protein n=1 Tax=Adineta ricciae TaxID=249248 RepID=A0A814QK68_ADIRI|nr:unnamed protein product [Adineta ricciae]CAF1121744.1 unnamed protein product [Adineta ricciae]